MVHDARPAIARGISELATVGPTGQGEDIQTFLDAVEDELKRYAGKKENVGGMPQKLSERFSTYWSSFSGYLRMTRNEAGHPTSVDPVTRDAVHSALLIFPEVARLAVDLQQWVKSSYS